MRLPDFRLEIPPTSNRREKLFVFLATGFYLSLVPPQIAVWLKRQSWAQKRLLPHWTGSGIAGAVWGLVTYVVLPARLAINILSLLLGTLFAVWISHRAEKILGRHDDPRIVIDEWIGCWIAMAGLRHHFGFEVVVAFILFRLFDVYKGPWGRKLAALPGGWGVVMDDVGAGLIANFFARIVVVCVGVL